MMMFVSTAGRSPTADLQTALAHGLAPDGGLYMPVTIEPVPDTTVRSLRGRRFAEVATGIASHQLAGVIDEGTVRRLVASALDFEAPLHPLDEDTFVLELFHGPTFAFKDVGARVLARLVRHLHGEDRLTVLVATSGDTGSAVAHAFFGMPNVRVVVLYPKGQVSRLQEAQFATLGGNVTALAVLGTFDDCQRLVKEAFGDEDLRRAGLTSANSINVGRLLPQVWYYWYAALALPPEAKPVIFSTPSGNFGNLAAGLIAKRMGAPIDGFVAATNVNDVVPEYLRTGVYSPRPSRPTLSNAMDVGRPSNLARIQTLYGGDVAAIRRDVFGSAHDDPSTLAAIRTVFDRHGYVMDPHTAVGWLALQARRAALGPATGVLLATAHPAKFPEVVEPLVGSLTTPPALAACFDRPLLSRKLPADGAALKAVLSGPRSAAETPRTVFRRG